MIKLRIGYLYDLEAYPPKGGNHRHAYELTQGFLKQGHSVLVVDDPTMPSVTNYTNKPASLKQFINNIDILYVRIDARSTRLWQTLNACIKIINKTPIVWEVNSPANENLAYSWLGGMKCQANQKEEGLFRKFRRWFHAFRKQPKILLEEHHRCKLAKNVSAAICVSSAVGQYAEEMLKINNILVLPNGGPIISETEIKQRRERRQDKTFTVLYGGSAIYPWQGLNYLANVIELAKKEAPEIHFVLAVNQLIPSLPSSKNVTILEKLNQEQMRDAICASDVCIALIPEWPWAKYKFHGSPTKLFEYMAFMVPVLTSNHGQMRDIIQNRSNGLLCNNTPHDILDKLIYLKDNPQKAQQIGENGWKNIQSDFNWEQNTIKTLNCFQEILDKNTIS